LKPFFIWNFSNNIFSNIFDHLLIIDAALEYEDKNTLNEKPLADVITLCQERGKNI
jgi:hypothetical protein